MAKLITSIQETDKTAQGKSFDRMEALPLDSSSIWASKTLLDAYASSPESSAQTTSYVGQIVSVVSSTEVVPYQIYNTSGTLNRIPYKEDIYSLSATDLDNDSSSGLKPVTTGGGSVTLSKKETHTPQTGYTGTADLPSWFKGIRVSTATDYGYFGIDSLGEFHTLFYNGGDRAQGFSAKRTYKSYENGSPTFYDITATNSATVTNSVTCNKVICSNLGSSWILARDNAAVKIGYISESSYHPIFSSKTPNGEISCGVLAKEDVLRWQYTSDNQYSNSKNVSLDLMSLHVKVSTDDGSAFTGYGNLVVSGSVSATSYVARSDKRLKENIKPHIFNDKKSILDLPIYKYDFISGGKNNIGCMAQDLMEICPEIVHKNDDGYLSIEESKIVYLLLDEVKQLRKELDELRKEYH